jgi:hypothetical protein
MGRDRAPKWIKVRLNILYFTCHSFVLTSQNKRKSDKSELLFDEVFSEVSSNFHLQHVVVRSQTVCLWRRPEDFIYKRLKLTVQWHQRSADQSMQRVMRLRAEKATSRCAVCQLLSEQWLHDILCVFKQAVVCFRGRWPNKSRGYIITVTSKASKAELFKILFTKKCTLY